MPSLCCRLAALLPLVTFAALTAGAQGTAPSLTQIGVPVVGFGSAGGTSVPIQVQPAPPLQTPLHAPTGTVTLFDGANMVGSAGTLADTSGFNMGSFAQVFGTPDPTVVAAANNAVWGDFNEDGTPDLVAYGSKAGSGGQQTLVLQAFLGNENTPPVFTPPQLIFAAFRPLAAQQLALPQQIPLQYPLAVLDVDGDGHLDLLAGNVAAYGNGDGTFGRVGVLASLASVYSQTYAVDIDGDGKTDIVAVDTPPSLLSTGTVQYAFTVFRNNGGGSFTAMGPYPLAPSFAGGSSGAYNIFGLSFADLNGDGRIDVLAQSNVVPFGNSASNVQSTVMLNLGSVSSETSFGAPQAIDTSAIPNLTLASTAFADLNGDGKLDLVLGYQANTGNNGVATLLGAGDGTFAAPVNFPLGSSTTVGSTQLPLVTEDVNGDGKPDVMLGTGVVLMGAGDGTLTPGTPLFTSTVAAGNAPPAYALLTAPPGVKIPGGGSAPFFALVYINLQSSANAVFVPQVGSGATVTAMLASGPHSLSAHYSGDATYAASVSAPLQITLAPPVNTITIASSANPVNAAQSITFTATLGNPTAMGTVTFQDAYPGSDPLQPILDPSATILGTATIANGVATFTTKLPAGLHTITAAYGDVYNPSATAQLTENVNLPFNVSNSASGISLTTTPGKSASTQISLQALEGFSGPITFDCRDGAPVTCAFSPATVNLAGTGTSTVTLTVTATTRPTMAQVSPSFVGTILACGVPFFALFGIASKGRSRALFGVIAIALCGISCLGCGGGGQQSSSADSLPAGAYPFYVTVISGQNELVMNATLTVQ